MIKKEIKSFGNALNGLLYVLRSERHFQFHVIAAIAVILLGYFYNVSSVEWAILLLCIGVVMLAEISNTAIEVLCDKIQPEYDDEIKIVKDIAAASVLIVSLVSAVIGVVILLPYLLPH